jgi:hypothetical protein
MKVLTEENAPNVQGFLKTSSPITFWFSLYMCEGVSESGEQ